MSTFKCYGKIDDMELIEWERGIGNDQPSA